MTPTLGRIVLYKADYEDNQHHLGGNPPGKVDLPAGNAIISGASVMPAMVVGAWGDEEICNLQVFADGNYSLWRPSTKRSAPNSLGHPSEPGTWCWPVIDKQK